MTALAVALACLTLVYLAHKSAPRIDRVLALAERIYTPVMPASESVVDLPADVRGQCAQWVDALAVASAEGRAREIYAETGDWDRVRALLAEEMRA